MKLVFVDLGITKHIAADSQPNIRWNPKTRECLSASFKLDEVLDETDILTGQFDMLADDDMPLNSWTVEEFLRYEKNINEDDGTTRLFFTQDPIPEPPEPTPEPTPEEALAAAKQGRDVQILEGRDVAIMKGVTVETEYGEETFPLTTQNMSALLGIQGIIAAGATYYPYHSLDLETGTSNSCKVYTAEDLAKISATAIGYVTYCETYANMLLQWLNRETDISVVYTIEYGAELPEDLKAYLDMIMQSAADATGGLPVSAEDAAGSDEDEQNPVETPVEE